MQPDPAPRSTSFRPARAAPPAAHNHARRHTRTDLNRALRLLRRSPFARAFMLTPPPPALDLSILANAPSAVRPLFTIATEEVQRGSLPGRIALRYLGLPAFSDSDGLSGGAVVTTYASRSHPLHAPAVMEHVRVGRYVRDNATGDWCIITRNRRDRLTRLQYIRTSDAGARERICLTCSSDLFDRGRFLDSVLFNCHDNELRVCNHCATSGCLCRPGNAVMSHKPGLATLAQNVVSEGPGEWMGTVRVTVVSNLTNNPMLNLDETMTVRSSYQQAIDTVLAAEMQRLAIVETATHAATVQYAVPGSTGAGNGSGEKKQDSGGRHDDGEKFASTSNASDKTRKHGFNYAASTAAAFEATQVGVADQTFDDVFASEDHKEVANHFLIMQEGAISDALAESAMLPADPSTLPGGNGLCLEGMEMEPEGYSYFAPPSPPSGAAIALANEELVANALAGADLDDLFLPTGADDALVPCPMPEADPAGAEEPAACAAIAASQSQDSSISSLQALDDEPEPFCPKGADAVETLSSLTVGSTGSGSTKSPSACQASTSDGSGSAEHSFAETNVDEHVPKTVKEENMDISPPVATAPTSPASVSVPSEDHKMQAVPCAPLPAPSMPIKQQEVPLPTGGPSGAVPNAVPLQASPAGPVFIAGPGSAHGAMGQPVMMPATAFNPQMSMPVSGIHNAAAAPIAAPGLFPGGAMLAPNPWMMAPIEAAPAPAMAVNPASAPTGASAAPPAAFATDATSSCSSAAAKLAPRPQGLAPAEGFIWQMGAMPLMNPGFAYTMPAQMARWQRLERERKAEERRKKNRQAAARSNARKKGVMDGYRAEIAAEIGKADGLRGRQRKLKTENAELRRRIAQMVQQQHQETQQLQQQAEQQRQA